MSAACERQEPGGRLCPRLRKGPQQGITGRICHTGIPLQPATTPPRLAVAEKYFMMKDKSPIAMTSFMIMVYTVRSLAISAKRARLDGAAPAARRTGHAPRPPARRTGQAPRPPAGTGGTRECGKPAGRCPFTGFRELASADGGQRG